MSREIRPEKYPLDLPVSSIGGLSEKVEIEKGDGSHFREIN